MRYYMYMLRNELLFLVRCQFEDCDEAPRAD